MSYPKEYSRMFRALKFSKIVCNYFLIVEKVLKIFFIEIFCENSLLKMLSKNYLAGMKLAKICRMVKDQ